MWHCRYKPVLGSYEALEMVMVTASVWSDDPVPGTPSTSKPLTGLSTLLVMTQFSVVFSSGACTGKNGRCKFGTRAEILAGYKPVRELEFWKINNVADGVCCCRP